MTVFESHVYGLVFKAQICFSLSHKTIVRNIPLFKKAKHISIIKKSEDYANKTVGCVYKEEVIDQTNKV